MSAKALATLVKAELETPTLDDDEMVGRVELTNRVKAWVKPEDLPKMVEGIASADIQVQKQSFHFIPIVNGKYSIRVIVDPIDALLAGYNVDCCQHPIGEGRLCALHGVSSKNGAIIGIYHKSKIVGTSWLWATGDIACFDSIELLEGYDVNVVVELVEKAAEQLPFGTVMVGANSGMTSLLTALVNKHGAVEENDVVPSDYPLDGYTDAERVVVIKGGQYKKPDEDFLMATNIAAIEREAFPAAMRALQRAVLSMSDVFEYCSSNPRDAIILYNSESYCLIDSSSWYVADIATRKPLPLSAVKEVLAFLSRHTEEFTADLREVTSYKLVKFAEKRGMLEITSDERYERNGEWMHSVTCIIPKRIKTAMNYFEVIKGGEYGRAND